MKVKNLDLSFRVFTPLRICLVGIALLTGIVLWQFGLIASKTKAIANLAAENSDLRKSLLTIDDQLAELKDSASDVRLFQREIIKVIKGIDQSYPVSLADARRVRPNNLINDDSPIDTADILDRANESIFKLSSSQENLRFETATLLGKAVSIKDILTKTPSITPVTEGRISSGFGRRPDPISHAIKMHHGHDYAAPIGTPVKASADGKVIMAGQNSELGKYILLEHEGGISTLYGHLSVMHVKKDDIVKQKNIIGRVGNTGLRTTGAHLHYEVRRNGRSENPKRFLIDSHFRNFY